MANTFKNYTSLAVGTSNTTVYTVPASTSTVTIGMNLANIETSQINVSVQAAGAYVVKDAPIPAGSALSVLDGKIVLEATDTVVVSSSANSSVDVLLSVLEQT